MRERGELRPDVDVVELADLAMALPFRAPAAGADQAPSGTSRAGRANHSVE